MAHYRSGFPSAPSEDRYKGYITGPRRAPKLLEAGNIGWHIREFPNNYQGLESLLPFSKNCCLACLSTSSGNLNYPPDPTLSTLLATGASFFPALPPVKALLFLRPPSLPPVKIISRIASTSFLYCPVASDSPTTRLCESADAQSVTGHDQFLDLGRALIEGEPHGVAEVPFNRVLV